MRLFRTLSMLLVGALVAALVSATSAGAQESPRIHLLHGIPDTDVDVYVGGSPVFEGFAFGDAQDLSAFAGTTLTDIEVRLAGTDTVAISVPSLALPSSGNYTAIAHLDAEGTPTISVFENDTSTIAAGEGRLVVRHTAAAPEVDIRAGGAVAFAAVPNGAEGAVDLAAGTVTADVVPAGADEPVVIGPADLPIAEGSSLIVYAVGSLEAETLTVLTESIDGLGSAPAAVNTGNSPVSDSGSGLVYAVAAALIAATAAFGVFRFRRDTI
ncbi:MAG: DUF4397 domain-containing protein [Acidimicrobiales bacterium]